MAVFVVCGWVWLNHSAWSAAPVSPPVVPEPVPADEYVFYDHVVEEKFLTSQTTLVIVNRRTATAVVPEGPPLDRAFFSEQQFFDGALSQDLITDFLLKNMKPSRLEPRFRLNVPVRFVSDEAEQPEVSLAPMAASFSGGRPVQDIRTVVGILTFSRVATSQRGDQALVYAEEDREDASGSGLLIWFRRGKDGWGIQGTEVLWVARPEE